MSEETPKRYVELSRQKLIETFEKLSKENLGSVMREYLVALICELRKNERESCNTVGLYFLMMETIRLTFSQREARDAVQNAIPAFVNQITRDSQSSEEKLQAEKFVEEFLTFIPFFDSKIKTMQNRNFKWGDYTIAHWTNNKRVH